VASPATLVTLGDLRNPAAVLCLFGLVLIAALNYRRVAGGTLIGILAVTVIGIPLWLATYSGIVSAPPSLSPTLLQLDFSRLHEPSFLIVIFSFLFVDVFDNAGTLIGVTHQAGLTDADGNLPRMKQALIADSFAAMFGALIGTSTTTSYIESAAGVAAGGRTGLTAFFVALLFVAALFFRSARRHGAGLCVLGGAGLRRLCDGARLGRDGLGRHDRNRAGGGRGGDHAADVFDRDRDRAWLHHLCADQAHCRPLRRRQAGGAGVGADLRREICARLTLCAARERFLESQKIPPGEALLQRAA
jgi:hypothetical protein